MVGGGRGVGRGVGGCVVVVGVVVGGGGGGGAVVIVYRIFSTHN